MLLKKFICGPFFTNTIVFFEEKTKKGAVIDPAPDSLKKILPYIEKEKIHLKKIFLTHTHWDHIADVKKVKEKFSAKIFVHIADAKNLEYPGSDRLPIFEEIEGIPADVFVENNKIYMVGQIKIKVIHTPGHTPGSVCYYLPEEEILFSGDTLFQGSIGNLSFPTSEPSLMWPSLKKLATLPEKTRVIPGHGVETTIKKEKWIVSAEEYFS